MANKWKQILIKRIYKLISFHYTLKNVLFWDFFWQIIIMMFPHRSEKIFSSFFQICIFGLNPSTWMETTTIKAFVCVYIFAVLHYFPLFFIESPLQQHQQTIFAIVNLINFNLIFFWPNWFHLNQLNLICFSLQENQFKSFYLAPTIKISPRWWKKEWMGVLPLKW